jgi:streptogramin lyase
MTRQLRLFLLAVSLGGLAVAGLAKVMWHPHTIYAAENRIVLTGTVKSASGEAIGGVTVSAKIDGRSMTTSVFTDERGNYYFPPLEAGTYQVWAQAVGYERARGQVDLTGTVQRQDFAIKETKDIALQLSGDQLVAALPEDTAAHRRMKDVFIRNCTGCHEGNVPLQNRFDAQGWEAFIIAMSRIEAYGSFPLGRTPSPVISHFQKDLAAYLAEMRGPGPSPMRLKVPPPPAGDAARTVVYEYDLPLEDGGGYILNNGSDWSVGASVGAGGGLGLHDATVDLNGNLWFTYNQRGSVTRTIGKIDTRTGHVTDFKYPGQEGRAALSHGMYRAKDGTIWFTVNTGAPVVEGADIPGRLGKIDPKTEKLEVFTPARGMSGVTLHVDEDAQGQIWASTAMGALRFDPTTRTFTEFRSLTSGSSYGVAADRDGNGWWTQINIDIVGHSDIKTGKSFEIRLPPNPHPFLKEGDLSAEDLKAYGPRGTGAQAPRRPAADKNGDDIWIPNYSGQNLLRINSRTLKTTYYPAPVFGLNPYMTAVDNSHNVWMSLQGGDQIARFNPKTEKWTLYSWPSRGTGLRTFALLDQDGELQVVGAYFNGNRVGRMVMRTEQDLQVLKTQVQTTARAR